MMKTKRCKKGKQFVALLLALIMVSGLTAFAAGGETSSDAPGDGKSTTSVTELTDTGESDDPSEGTDTGSAGDGQQNSDDTSKDGTGSAEGDVSSEDSDTRTEENRETADTVSEDSTSEEKSEEAGDTEEVSVFDVNELAEDTVISSDETKGIAQLENLIPDINFRTEVWRSLSVAGQLGDPEDPQYEGLEGDELYKAVLGNFTGHVYASGYVKDIQYIFSFQFRTSEDGPWRTHTGTSSSYEGALHVMQTVINGFLALGDEVDQESASVTSRVIVTEERKPDKQLIKDITGVVYLRKAERIDFTDNKITSLIPLDRVSIADEFCNGNIEEVRRWFGEPSRNTIFTFAGNPLTDFPERMPGRIYINPLFSRVPVSFEKKPVIIVKDPDEGLPLGITVDMPEIRLNGQPIQFHAPDLRWTQTLTEGQFAAVYVPDDSGRNTGDRTGGIISATGISHSGEVTFSIGTMATDMQKTQVYWDSATVGTDSLAPAGCGITVVVQQQVRVLYEVLPGEPDGSIEISLNKYELGTENLVSGAVYRLFKMEMKKNGEDPVYTDGDKVTIGKDGCAVNQDGEVIGKPVDESGKYDYTTGEKGSFTCNADLGTGTYCFIEIKSPEGYEVNTNPVMFTVEASDTVQISGGDRLTKVELSGIAKETYQLYERESSDDSGTWNLYNNDDGLSFSPDEEGVIEIEGLEDGSYQLRPLLTSSEGKNIEFEVNGGTVSVTNGGILAKAESGTYIDRYSDPISITLPQPAKDQQLDSLTIEWYKADNSDVEQRSFKVGERIEVGDTIYEKATAEEVRKATQEFINLNKGTADKVGKIQGQVTITPVYKYKPSKPLKAEDPAKVQFSFVKTDGDPSDVCKRLAGAEFTLYYADDNWEWSEDAEGVYKTARAAEENGVVGVVSFGDLDSGNYIMKETDAPDGYSALPGYWKITANAWAAESDQKLIFKYVGEDGTPTDVSEDNLIPDDAYGNNYYIPNYPMDELPSMGGGGTRMFTVFGLLFTGTAIMLFVCARRNKKLKGV